MYLENLMKVAITAPTTKEKLTIASLCADKPTVFVFIRRFGCALCRWGAKDIAQIIPTVANRYVL